MRYYRKNGLEFLENGMTRAQVGTIDTIRIPQSPGRVIKMVTVVAIENPSDTNPIREGECVALSFPESQANNKDYVWKMDDPNEEVMVPLKLKLT